MIRAILVDDEPNALGNLSDDFMQVYKSYLVPLLCIEAA